MSSQLVSISVLLFDSSSTTVLQEISSIQGMSVGSTTRSGLRRRLIRGIVLLFLMHTAIDIASPDLCRGELLGDRKRGSVAATRPQAASIENSYTARVQKSDNQPTNEPSEQPHDDDDCFCCCTHVLPETVTAAVPVTDLPSKVTNLEHHSVLSPPLARAFHPPRFA